MIKEENSNRLRICSYNILRGGESRLDLILKVIREINPDVCGILEAVGWESKIKDLEKIKNDLGYKFLNVFEANSKYNIAVLSRVALKTETIKDGIRHVIVKATIHEGIFKDSSVFFVHLSPKLEDDRILEVDKLLSNIYKYTQAIIMGDLNSLSIHDPYDQKVLLKKFKENNITKYGIDSLRFDVVNKLELSGLVDGAQYLKEPFVSTTPTSSNTDSNHVVDIRIDYAFFTRNLLHYLNKVEVVKNNISNLASDHYPLFIDLQK